MLLSVHKDNPRLFDHRTGKWTEEGQAYLRKLERLTGARRSRLFEGKWVAAEGLVYEKFDEQTHMINLNELPSGWQNWNHYWSIDWGFKHPFSWSDWIEDPEQGTLYRLRGLYRTRMIVEDAAREIMKITEGDHYPRAIICDHDAGDRATFERHTNLLTLPAYKEIQPGIKNMIRRLDPNWNNTGHPGIMYVRDGTIGEDQDLKERGLPTRGEQEYDGYVWDEVHNREVNSKKDELPIDLNNHHLDEARYMAAFVDDLAIDPEEEEHVLVLDDDDQMVISPY